MSEKRSRSAGLDVDLRRRLGANLRQARLDSGLTLEEVAERLSVNMHVVWRWEAGKSAPMIDRLVQLAAFYGVTVDSLLAKAKKEWTVPELASEIEHTLRSASSELPREELRVILDFIDFVRSRRRHDQRSPLSS